MPSDRGSESEKKANRKNYLANNKIPKLEEELKQAEEEEEKTKIAEKIRLAKEEISAIEGWFNGKSTNEHVSQEANRVIEEIKDYIDDRLPQKKKKRGEPIAEGEAASGENAPKKAKNTASLQSLQNTLVKLNQKKTKGDELPGMIADLQTALEGHREIAKNGIEDGNNKQVRKAMGVARKISVQKALKEKVFTAYQKNEAALLAKIAEQEALIKAFNSEDAIEGGSEDEKCANPDCAKK